MAIDWDQSYPPALWTPTGATAGAPGAWTPGAAAAPETLAEANALGLSLGAAWAQGQWVELRRGEDIYWTGAAFAAGQAPAPPPPPEPEAAQSTKRRKVTEE